MNYSSLIHPSVMAKLKRQAEDMLKKRIAKVKILNITKNEAGQIAAILFIDKTGKHGVERKAVVEYEGDNAVVCLEE